MAADMADVAVSRLHHRHASSIGPMAAGTVNTAAPVIEMLPNPDFSFPRRPQTAGGPSALQPLASTDQNRRPMSMQLDSVTAASPRTHRRAVSTLPSFSFNSTDTTGLAGGNTPPLTPDESTPATPSRRGHKRGGSEFVGGDSRFGMAKAVSSSPTKTNALPLPVSNPVGPPAGRRGHAHRRSQAMSSHDVSSIMQPSESEPRTSTSLPNTPLEHPALQPHPLTLDRSTSVPDMNAHADDIFRPASDESDAARPPSRARVGFKDHVDIIPRPLSVISSETESSVSTIRGHSVNNSISSMMTLSNPGTPASRTPPKTTTPPFADQDSKPRSRRSLEVSKKLEVEGRWLQRSPSPNLKRPHSDSAAGSPSLSVSTSDPPATPRLPHKKKHSISHALGFDRRKSEPLIGSLNVEPSRLSAISVASAYSASSANSEMSEDKKSSRRRIASWAKSKMSRKSKSTDKLRTEEAMPANDPEPATQESVPGSVPFTQPMMDLDAVFASQASDDLPRLGTPTQPRIEVLPASPTSRQARMRDDEGDDTSPMVDLDAALGPLRTPPMSSGPRRKQLHSSRLTKDFDGPGGHYNIHRRANSSPVSMMTPFDYERPVAPAQTTITDVFEEEEPEEDPESSKPRPTSTQSAHSDEAGTGISIVDSDNISPDAGFGWSSNDGLGIQRSWEAERPSTSWGSNNSRLSTATTERRTSSIIEDIIVEESSPVEAPTESSIEIVPDHEEPRASSLTKSSDSSETPTILAQPGMLPLPEGQGSLMTPDTYQTSAFSSPDFGVLQGSFDTSRIGTAASSITDGRTTSSCVTGDASQSCRMSIDDVPSLTSSRSTMMSTMHANTSRRDFSSASSASRTPSSASAALDPAVAAERRRKRASIQSLSQLMGVRSKASDNSLRPQTASSVTPSAKGKKEHRLKKLMFWKSKQPDPQSAVART